MTSKRLRKKTSTSEQNRNLIFFTSRHYTASPYYLTLTSLSFLNFISMSVWLLWNFFFHNCIPYTGTHKTHMTGKQLKNKLYVYDYTTYIYTSKHKLRKLIYTKEETFYRHINSLWTIMNTLMFLHFSHTETISNFTKISEQITLPWRSVYCSHLYAIITYTNNRNNNEIL